MLPKIDVPKYTLKLPSTGKKIEYRPFLVKEEKILLTAMETTEDDDMERAIRTATKHIIDNCTFGKINADKLPEFDVDFLFLNIRSKSRGEEVDMSFTCNNEVDGKECGEINSLKVMIDKVRVKFPEEDLTKVEVTEDIGIKFKYLTTGELGRYEQEKNNVTKLFKVIVDSIDYIYDDEKVYKGSETPKKELLEFIESLNDVVFEKINRFFNEKPMLNHVEKFTCKKCGYKHVIELEGLTSFFG
jgi:hypothetical protein